MEKPTLFLNKWMRHHPAVSSTYLPIIALSCTIALSASLTSLNRDLVREQASHQSIFTSFFCIEAAAVYALYMIISRMLSFFLSYIESSSSASSSHDDRPGYMASYYYDHIEEDELLTNNANASDQTSYKRTSVFSHESPFFIHSSRPGFNNGHREALISSMYLGGTGAFLALPALCFWDYSITASFLLSLTLIALFSDHTKHKEFSPNQDKQRVLSVLQRFRWLLYGSLITVILGVAFQDSYYYYYYYYNIPQEHNHTGLLVISERPWPMMLLSFSSPLLMRMGTINPRTIAHNIIMSPSQSLEVGLPISNLLAILVLCWYSPLDSVFRRPSAINIQLFVPMLVLCPSCLAARLAFILRGFRNKQTLGTIVPLVFTCVVVQQAVDRKLKNAGDWGLLAGTLVALLLSLLLVLYKRKVLTDRIGQQTPLLNDDKPEIIQEEDLLDDNANLQDLQEPESV